MKSVLIAIRPQWCEKIASGKKTIEVRKTAPKEVPFKAYIYCSYGKDKENYMLSKRGKVIGEFICDKVDKFNLPYPAYFNEVPQEVKDLIKSACLTMTETHHYLGQKAGYGWHISDIKIYDNPRELSEFFVLKKCDSCRDTGYESTACCYDEDCTVPEIITRPPQSWQYVEEMEE